MNAKDLQAVLPAIIKSRVSTLIWGWHGGGKSQIVRQVVEEMYGKRNSEENGGGPTLVDLRLGQMEIGDLTGIPRNVQENGYTKTIWGLPEWWPTHPDSKGVLFVDEINRAATPDVLQASFQLVLDFRLHTHSLPPGWSVVAAANPEDSDYQVLRLDPALMDRFLHIAFAPTAPDWKRWSENKITTRVLREFAMSNKDVLGLRSAPNLNVTTSPRSMELLDRIFAAMTDSEREAHGYTIAAGLIGDAYALALRKYLTDNMDKPVDAEKLLNEWDEVKAQIKKWVGTKKKKKDGKEGEEELTHVRADLLKAQFDVVTSYISTELKGKLNDVQAKNLVKFMDVLPVELAVAGLHEIAEDSRLSIIETIAPLIVNTSLARKWARILQTGDTKMKQTGSVDDE